MEKRMHPSSVKFSRALAVGDNLSRRRIIDLGNHSVKLLSNICNEIAIKAYFHFSHYKPMET